MRLGEFFAIMAADPGRLRLGQRQNRQLNECSTFDGAVQHSERRRIDHIFRIVQHHHAIGFVRRGFFHAHRTIQPVEAVRLRRRAGAIVHDHANTRIVFRNAIDGSDGARIIWVAANENGQIALRPDGCHPVQRIADNLRLKPGGNEDGRFAC